MANALYDKARESFLKGEIAWDANAIRAVLIDTAIYSVDLAVHQNYSDLSGVVGTESPVFASKTTAAGVADAADITFSSVPGPTTIEAIVIFKDTGLPSTDKLIAYIDTATGLPITSTGSDIIVAWDAGANRIFKL